MAFDPRQAFEESLRKDGIDVASYPEGALDRAWAIACMEVQEMIDFYRNMATTLDKVVAAVEELDPALAERAAEIAHAY